MRRKRVGGNRGRFPLERGESCLLLFLKKAVDFEPVGASAVAGPAFRHSHEQTFPKTTCFAGGAVFLVDYAFSAIFAFRD